MIPPVVSTGVGGTPLASMLKTKPIKIEWVLVLITPPNRQYWMTLDTPQMSKTLQRDLTKTMYFSVLAVWALSALFLIGQTLQNIKLDSWWMQLILVS